VLIFSYKVRSCALLGGDRPPAISRSMTSDLESVQAPYEYSLHEPAASPDGFALDIFVRQITDLPPLYVSGLRPDWQKNQGLPPSTVCLHDSSKSYYAPVIV
jgi:hypothetical protein